MASDSQFFYYRATGPEGGLITGHLAVKDRQAAIKALVAQGLTPIRVENGPIKDSFFGREVGFGSSKRLSSQDCETFCRELHLLIASGVGITDALTVLVTTQNKRSRVHQFTSAVHKAVRFGRPLSEATTTSGFILPVDFGPVIQAGETSGSLIIPLAMLAESYRANANFTREFVGALIYPAFLLVIAVVALGIISFLVAPTLAELFYSMDKPVPAAIAVLAGSSKFLSQNAIVLAPLIGAILAGLIWASNRPSARTRLKNLAFRLPIFGSLFVWAATSRFAATLHLYVQSNVPMAKALPGACLASGFPNAGRTSGQVAILLRNGGKLGDALKLVPLLPPSTWQLLNIGESGGRLHEALSAVVAESQHRFETRAGLIGNMLAPVLIVFVGATVGSLVFVVFSALLEVNNIAS